MTTTGTTAPVPAYVPALLEVVWLMSTPQQRTEWIARLRTEVDTLTEENAVILAAFFATVDPADCAPRPA